MSAPHVDLPSADADRFKAKTLAETPSGVDVEDVQGDGTLSARGQVGESLDDLGPKAEVLQLGADSDTARWRSSSRHSTSTTLTTCPLTSTT
jgi:hypothetical protein